MTTTLIFSLPSNLKFEFGWYLVEFVLLTESLQLYGFYAYFFSNFPCLIRKALNCIYWNTRLKTKRCHYNYPPYLMPINTPQSVPNNTPFPMNVLANIQLNFLASSIWQLLTNSTFVFCKLNSNKKNHIHITCYTSQEILILCQNNSFSSSDSQTIQFSQLLQKSIASSNSSGPTVTTSPSLSNLLID